MTKPFSGLFFFLISFLFALEGFAQPLTEILPKNGAFVQDNQVELSWNSVSSAINYTVEIATNEAFTAGFLQSSFLLTTNWQTPVLAHGIWFWRVKANTGTQIFVSNSRTFRIFHPNDVTGNTLWLASDSAVTLNGSAVSSWNDISGNGHVFSQGNGADQPQKLTNVSALNNQSVVRFDGTSDFLNAGNILNISTNSLTSFLVAKGSGMFYSKFGNGSTPFNIYSCYSIGAEEGHEMAGASYQTFSASAISDYHVLNFSMDRANSSAKLLRNFNPLVTSALTGISSPTYNFSTSNPLLLGRYSLSGNPFYLNGDISEVIFYNFPLNDSLRQLVQNHLMYKYAPPVNLGKDTMQLSSFCPILLQAPTGFTDYLWSTGATTNSISVLESGTYWLSAKNIFGVVTTDTIQVTFPEIQSPPTVGICMDSSVIWNTNLSFPFTFQWSDNSNLSFLQIDTVGNYWVEVFDTFGCSALSDTFSFQIDTYENEVSLGNDTTLCAGNSIELQIGLASTVSYNWSDSTSSTSMVIPISGTYFVQTTNNNGCIAQDTIHVTVAGTAPMADFVAQNTCLNATLTLQDASISAPADPIVSWSWNFGDGQTSNSQNTSHMYGTSGIFIVELNLLSNGGCSGTHSDTIEVYALPTANFSASGLCSENMTSFTDLSSAGGASIIDYFWDFGQPSLGTLNNSTVANPSVILPNSGTFAVVFNVTDANNCSDDTTLSITIQASPHLDFSLSPTCEGEAVSIVNNTSGQLPLNFNWDFGDGTNSTLQNPVKIFPNFGPQIIHLQVLAANGCSKDSTVSVSIYAKPFPSIAFPNICAGTYAEIISNSAIAEGFIENITWVFNQTDSLFGDTVHFFVPDLTQQEVQLLVESDQGCVAEVSNFFEATTILHADFELETNTVANNSAFELTNTSIGASNYQWNFGDGNGSTDFSPSHSYSDEFIDSTVGILLIASNNLGCIDSAFQNIQIQANKLDLALKALFYQAQGSFAIIGVEVKNEGTVPFDKINLRVSSDKGYLFQEIREGLLLPTESSIYVFQSQPLFETNQDDDHSSFYCVEGRLDEAELFLENNEVCKNVENTEAVLLPIYPNPAVEFIELNLLVTQKTAVLVQMTDEMGRIVHQLYSGAVLESGLYSNKVDIQNLESGCYFVRILTEKGEKMQRLVIVH